MATYSRRQIYGKVKQAVIEAFTAGLTYADIQAKHGYRRESIYNAARQLGLTLKRKPSEHRHASIAQSAERLPCKQKVAGSTPAAGSILTTNA